MVQGSKYETLAEDSLLKNQINTCSAPAEHVQCKKHGVWCRIKTRLRLKKRRQGKVLLMMLIGCCQS